ncbi:MAG TPA: phage holin family protein [Candidatus Sumerlaeota bacterium]|nr:MAG: hypothetical protein BWZ08_02089 [candidate division BRC1 bacterium ADurb.BinA292]HOE97829.1 phage holin family protein [Candidatus Sumerlaeota bacterium]HOR26827.1 phage holin family protein [Candidatus Sumerlaeota bacterium]HPK02582.1 phage holin family protein [Candidatus Sumerlaeota bacterium]
MTELVELFLSAIDVIKAELRKSREGVYELAVIAGLVVCAFFLLVVAFGLIVAGTFIGLVNSNVPVPLAALCTSVLCILIAWSLIWFGRERARRR